jgi:hypothetical protein
VEAAAGRAPKRRRPEAAEEAGTAGLQVDQSGTMSLKDFYDALESVDNGDCAPLASQMAQAETSGDVSQLVACLRSATAPQLKQIACSAACLRVLAEWLKARLLRYWTR